MQAFVATMNLEEGAVRLDRGRVLCIGCVLFRMHDDSAREHADSSLSLGFRKV